MKTYYFKQPESDIVYKFDQYQIMNGAMHAALARGEIWMEDGHGHVIFVGDYTFDKPVDMDEFLFIKLKAISIGLNAE